MQKVFPFYSIGDFINEPENPTRFEIIFFENMAEPQVEDLHKHTFYEILFVDGGESKQTIDYKEYLLKPQSLFFISPGQLHYFEQWTHLRGGSILFTDDFFLLNYPNKDKLFELSFLDNFHANPLLALSEDAFKDIRHIISFLLWEEKQRKDYLPSIAQSLLHVLVAQIQRCIDADQHKTISKRSILLYKSLKGLLDANFMENLPVSAYARKLHISAHYLNLICKEVTGKTAGEVIRDRSLLEAKRLLTYSDLSVAEVAATLHFFDSSYFARIFKTHTGQSPASFKKVMSEKYRLL